MSNIKNNIEACLTLGAIGDCIGGFYEGKTNIENIDFEHDWQVSDDTQLTLATAEAIIKNKRAKPEFIAQNFLKWFNSGKLTGLGSSTLQALRGLQVGGHWALVGRQGEFAAGNGAAMRIAPLAFIENTDRQTIRDVCRITHKNDEAYTGALIIYYSIYLSIWKNKSLQEISDIFKEELPDTRVKDRLIEILKLQDISISELGMKYLPTGYVADSVPFAFFAATKIDSQNIDSIFLEIIKCGGDTDTVCSMTGQIIGATKGMSIIPNEWIQKIENVEIYKTLQKVINGL